MTNIKLKENNIKMEEIISEINQLLHNKGIAKNMRINYIINLLNINHSEESVIKKLLERIRKQNDNAEFMQKLYMLLGEKCLKQDLDQYYTPINISKFIKEILNVNKDSLILEPSAGTGDLAILLEDCFIDFIDISEEVTKLLKINLNLRGFNENRYNIFTKNALIIEEQEKLYDFCLLNPPFGKKSITDNKSILDNYYLGKKKKKIELGKIFIERGLRSLKENGILIAIIPSGYLTNKNDNDLRKYIINNYKIIAIIELPEQTFKQSGTGVDTTLLIIENNNKDITNYDIFIEKLNKIEELNNITDKLKYFSYKKNISKLLKREEEYKYNIFILYNNNNKINIKEYLYYNVEIDDKNKFNLIDKVIKQKKIDKKKEIDVEKAYIYLDIGEVMKGDYNIENYKFGSTLPLRASYFVNEDDIIVSKLKGKISFGIICGDSKNIIVSNGLIVLRFKEEIYRLSMFKYLFNEEFIKQINSLMSGSIMASISDNDFLEKIKIPIIRNENELLETKNYITLLKKINSLKYKMINN